MFYIKPQNEEAFFKFEISYIKVSPTSGCYIPTIEEESQGIVVDGTPYSTNSKNPIKDIETAIYKKQEEWDAEIQRLYENKLCEEAKRNLIPELSKACSAAIGLGTKIKLSNGLEESFTYDINDQANISEMFNAILMGATEYPYHANGQACKMYSAKDIVTIYTTLSSLKTSQITYHNQLKQYVNSITSIEDVYKVTYGQELSGEYLENYNNIMNQAKVQMENIISKISQ